ncbi:hypothetical protein L0152_06430 [bacterium]|nr:hypothetical protein [bacterium]
MALLKVPCCIELEKIDCCDRLDYKYTLTYKVTVMSPAGRPQIVEVQVTIHIKIERCPGPYTLGDLVYTTTLLPGEQVRLYSTDRRSKFMYDKDTKLSYRHAQASEDQYYMATFGREMSDLTVTQEGESTSHSWGDYEKDTDAGAWSAGFVGGGSVNVEGEYDDHSTKWFLNSLHSHAESSHYRSEMATRTSSSVSVGEVATRTHIESESQDHFESSTRIFSNPNRCHAITFFFYRINREQTIKISLVAIERRVKDPAAPTEVKSRKLLPLTGVSVMPSSVLATASDRLDTEARAFQSVANRVAVETGQDPGTPAASKAATILSRVAPAPSASRADWTEPIPRELREQALAQVDEQLVKAGLVAEVGGQVNGDVVKKFFIERHFCLPTPGIMVKGCLDECDICEPELHEQIHLELERKKLENALLQKQIDLLEKSQEYRCCPKGMEEELPE